MSALLSVEGLGITFGGLRADTTPQVARIDAHLLGRQAITRLCYCGPVLHTRPERPHATREPLQFGAEIYGHAGREADVEILSLALDCLRAAPLAGLSVDLADARIVPALLDALGVDCIPLHCGMTGLFPHPPEPTPAHLAELSEAVLASGADIGFAVDPDVDRLVLVDERGTLLSEELTLAVAVDYLLGAEPGPVVVNLSTTGLIETVAGRHGVTVERTPVGEANVVARMISAGAVIGGEGNGGVIYPALHAGRDALVGIAMVLQRMAQKNAKFSANMSDYPEMKMIKDKFSQETPFDSARIRSRLAEWGSAEIDDRDGLRWASGDRWVHMRSSNTEPIVRVIAEAPSEAEARELVDRARGICEG